MIDPETFANKAVWYTTMLEDCAAVLSGLDARVASIRTSRQRARARALLHAKDRTAVGLGAAPADPAGSPLVIVLRKAAGSWAVGLPPDPSLRDALAELIGRAIPSPDLPDGGEITWTLAEPPISDAGDVAIEERVEAILGALVERASRRGAFGPEHHPREMRAWCLTPAGQAVQAVTRRRIMAVLLRVDQPTNPGPALLTRGEHLPRRTLAERLRIGPVRHEGRSDAAGDWGGPRRILAETADGARRLFISEGHSRSVPGRRRGGYTPASLWLQGDAAGGLFTRNVVIYRGRVTREVLAELSPRIEAGLDCPGLGPFLALYHTVTVEPDA